MNMGRQAILPTSPSNPRQQPQFARQQTGKEKRETSMMKQYGGWATSLLPQGAIIMKKGMNFSD